MDSGQGFSCGWWLATKCIFLERLLSFFNLGSARPRAVLQHGNGKILFLFCFPIHQLSPFTCPTLHIIFFLLYFISSFQTWQATILGRLLFGFVGNFSPCLLHTSLFRETRFSLLQAAIIRRPIPGKATRICEGWDFFLFLSLFFKSGSSSGFLLRFFFYSVVPRCFLHLGLQLASRCARHYNAPAHS